MSGFHRTQKEKPRETTKQVQTLWLLEEFLCLDNTSRSAADNSSLSCFSISSFFPTFFFLFPLFNNCNHSRKRIKLRGRTTYSRWIQNKRGYLLSGRSAEDEPTDHFSCQISDRILKLTVFRTNSHFRPKYGDLHLPFFVIKEIGALQQKGFLLSFLSYHRCATSHIHIKKRRKLWGRWQSLWMNSFLSASLYGLQWWNSGVELLT